MSRNSNQGPPDLDVAFRELISLLFKKRNWRKKLQERKPLKRLLEQGKKRHLEKKSKPGQSATARNNNRRTQEHVRAGQSSVSKTVSKPRVDAVKSKTENTVTQHVTALQRSGLRPTEPIKADEVLKQNVNANSTREWLHDSRALRQAFVLKELLEPPIALRNRPRKRYS